MLHEQLCLSVTRGLGPALSIDRAANLPAPGLQEADRQHLLMAKCTKKTKWRSAQTQPVDQTLCSDDASSES